MSSRSHYKRKNKKEWKNEQGTETQLKPVQHTERSRAEPRQWVLKQYGANWNTGHKPKNTQATSTQTLHFQNEFFPFKAVSSTAGNVISAILSAKSHREMTDTTLFVFI